MAQQGAMYTLTAVAESYDKPFKRYGGPINVPTNCEDAGGFYDNTTDTFRMNLHWLVCFSVMKKKAYQVQDITSSDHIHLKFHLHNLSSCHVNPTSGCNTIFLWSYDGNTWTVPDAQQEWLVVGAHFLSTEEFLARCLPL